MTQQSATKMNTIIITIETKDGTLERRYGYYDDSAEIDWNPIVNDMVDSIDKSSVDTGTSSGGYNKSV